MRALRVVVVDVLGEDGTQVPLVQREHVVRFPRKLDVVADR
jgi:hypothetical protein